jgi:Tfp pilus assembly protein PilF
MKARAASMLTAIAICGTSLVRAEAPRALPIDEAKIQAEMDALQDKGGPLTVEQRKKAAQLIDEGVKLHEGGKPDAAAAKYREAIALDPLSDAAYYELAFSLSTAGQQEAALDAIARALALDPKQEQYYVLKGNILDNLGFTQEAKGVYRALLGVKPDSYMGLINLGVCEMRAGEKDEAEATFKRARDMAPQQPSAYFQLAMLARQRRYNYEERALLEQFLERGAEDRRAETARKRLDEMKRVGVTIDPDEPFTHIALAVAMERARWNTEEHHKRQPEARGYELTFDEEKAVLGLLLSLWREQKKKEPSSQHGFYDLVLAVDDAGFLDEYVYYTKQRLLGDAANAWLEGHKARVQAFLDWARQKGYMGEEPAAETGGKAEQPSEPARLLKLLTESKVHYLIGAQVESAGARYLEQEGKRYRQGLNLAGPAEVRCAEDGNYASLFAAHQQDIAVVILRCHPQEGASRRRALAQLTSVGLKARDIDLGLDGGVLEKDGKVQVVPPQAGVAGGFVYYLAKAAWPREATLRERVAGKGAGSPSVEEEMYALSASAEGYVNSLEHKDENGKTAAPNAAWDELVRVVRQGQLRGFVLYEILARRYGLSLARLSQSDAGDLERYLKAFVEKGVGQ